jgi:hypothetical protein
MPANQTMRPGTGNGAGATTVQPRGCSVRCGSDLIHRGSSAMALTSLGLATTIVTSHFRPGRYVRISQICI